MMRSIFSSLASAFRTHFPSADTTIGNPSRRPHTEPSARDIQTKRADIWGQFLKRGQSRQKALLEKHPSHRGAASTVQIFNLSATAPNSPRSEPIKTYSEKTKNGLMEKKIKAIEACMDEIVLIQRFQKPSQDRGKAEQTKKISEQELELLNKIKTLERHVRKIKRLPLSTF